MKLQLGRLQVGHDGCPRGQIDEIESSLGVRLPSSYRRFLARFGRDDGASAALRGSDYYLPLLLDLRSGAEELLRESNSSFALHPQDFVFWMHQGYQFCFFRADGSNQDPPVFYYFEGWPQPQEKFISVSDWLRDYGVFVA